MIKFGERLSVTIIASLTGLFYSAVWLFANNLWILIPTSLVLAGILFFVVNHASLRRFFWALFGFCEVGFLGLFLIVEWRTAVAAAIIIAMTASVLITLWSRRVVAPIVFLREKPLRRAIAMMLMIGFFSYVSTAHALLIFFPSWWLLVAVNLGVVISSFVGSFLYAALYFPKPDRQFIIPASVSTLIMLEASVVAHLTSLGYLVIGVLVAWLWYLMQLFIRFNRDRRHIVWSRQALPLTINALFFVLVIWLIRYL